MNLADQIRSLAAGASRSIDEAHDYYTFSNRVWRTFSEVVSEGRKFSFHNMSTGTRIDEKSLIAESKRYRSHYLRSAAFQHFVSIFDDFFFGILRAWLTAFPASMSKKQIDIGTLLRIGSLENAIAAVVDKELIELKYERVAEWFSYLDRIVKLGTPGPDVIERLAEIKATRDILVHNQGIANATYISKAGALARCAIGEAIPLSEKYHRASWQTIRAVVQDLTAAAVTKAG